MSVKVWFGSGATGVPALSAFTSAGPAGEQFAPDRQPSRCDRLQVSRRDPHLAALGLERDLAGDPGLQVHPVGEGRRLDQVFSCTPSKTSKPFIAPSGVSGTSRLSTSTRPPSTAASPPVM
jgi:hypothetical protein